MATNVKKLPGFEPPANRLGADAAIESADDVERAFDELAWLKAREDAINAVADQKCRLIRSEAQKQMVVADGVTFADRRAALTAAIVAYAPEKEARKALFAGVKGKTRKFTHGEVKFAGQAERLEFTAQADGDKKSLAKMAGLMELGSKAEAVQQYLADRLAEFELFAATEDRAAVDASQLVDVKCSVPKGRIFDLYKLGGIEKTELATIGLRPHTPPEKCSTKVYDYKATPETTSNPAAA